MERTDFEQWNAREVSRLLALVETERRYYQDMVGALPVALVVLSAERTIVSSNRAFRQTFGLKTEDLRGRSIDQILSSPQLIEKIRDAHMHGPSHSSGIVQIDERPFRVAVVPMRNWEDDSQVETLLVLEDASGLEEKRFEAPTGDLPAIVWQADKSTLAFTSVTGGAERLLGYPASYWLSSREFFRERIHPDDRDATMSFYQAAMARPGDASAEFRAVTASGDTIWCRETIRVPVSGNVLTGVITDVSRRKQLEEQLLTSERTEALHGLASRLSHDLNNPLMIIAGYGEEMLSALKPQDPLRADVQQILTAAERISAITGQLLAFTRRGATPPQTVDVTRLLDSLRAKIRQAAGESVTVDVTRPAKPVLASADPVQLEEVILTLVAGAPRTAERSRITIACEVESIPEQFPHATLNPGIYATLVIHDDSRPQARVPVFESALAPKDPEKSPGPALAHAYALVREWGGDIAFPSVPSGSTFVVYLPYRGSEPAAIDTRPKPARPISQPAPGTILVVEDEAGIRALIQKILKRERYTVLEAASGEEAVALATRPGARIDLLLTDVMLPGITGRNVAERLLETFPELKVLYISGYTDDEAVQAGAFPPGSKFLRKPFTLDVLVRSVREALGG